ncbi:hypothetical protein L596_021641 [Steinernema carpocapsae]|uniref:Uncharacterized protein n=1 Tax=Steinernema carpocapsae TaxID=34508 RepID=A0A4U5MJC2_STECR|nr:hypothetical protein L596_021641 [Steinernema carpocapsae]
MDVPQPKNVKAFVQHIVQLFLTLLQCTIAVGYDGIEFAIFRWSKLSFFFAIVKFLDDYGCQKDPFASKIQENSKVYNEKTEEEMIIDFISSFCIVTM